MEQDLDVIEVLSRLIGCLPHPVDPLSPRPRFTEDLAVYVPQRLVTDIELIRAAHRSGEMDVYVVAGSSIDQYKFVLDAVGLGSAVRGILSFPLVASIVVEHEPRCEARYGIDDDDPGDAEDSTGLHEGRMLGRGLKD